MLPGARYNKLRDFVAKPRHFVGSGPFSDHPGVGSPEPTPSLGPVLAGRRRPPPRSGQRRPPPSGFNVKVLRAAGGSRPARTSLDGDIEK